MNATIAKQAAICRAAYGYEFHAQLTDEEVVERFVTGCVENLLLWPSVADTIRESRGYAREDLTPSRLQAWVRAEAPTTWEIRERAAREAPFNWEEDS